MRERTTAELMSVCDAYRARWLAPPGSQAHLASARGYGDLVEALNELHLRLTGPLLLPWCRMLLKHSDYDARAHGAFFLGQIGKLGLLGHLQPEVIAELGAVIRRAVEEDSKEMEAVDSAIRALGAIGHVDGIRHLREVLASGDPYRQGDSAWNAADALGQILGESFMAASDPAEAARVRLGIEGHVIPHPASDS